jgi:nicotinate-nucleotide adenylyltransferase
VTGLLGGTFNPPHNGHLALARAAEQQLELGRLVVLVAERPGHKEVQLNAPTRLRLARAAFPDHEVELDSHERTVDMLRDRHWRDPVFLLGADEFADFMTWKDPNGVVLQAHVAVATRPGYPVERLDDVLRQLDRPDRIRFFEIEPWPVSSREIRDRVTRGDPIDGLVPPAVAALIDSLGLYRRAPAPG